MGLASDFVISLNEHCFVCLSQLTYQKLDNAPNSIQCLSRFLKVDRRKVFSEEGVIPTYLLEKVENARLMVDLCENCAGLNHKFLKLFSQLEKIKMEVAMNLTMIHEKMLDSLEVDATMMRRCAESKRVDSDDKLEAKLEMAKAIRNDLIEKCSWKLNSLPPRVRLQEVTDEDIHRRRRKPGSPYLYPSVKQELPIQLEYDTFSGSVVTSSKIKLEPQHEQADTISQDGEDYMDEVSTEIKEPGELDSVKVNQLEDASVRYIRTNSGKYKCLVCSKVVWTHGAMYSHFNSKHLKIRFKCNSCDKSFAQKANLIVHHESVHFLRRYPCRHCCKTFTSPVNRYHHLRLTKCSHKNPYKGPGSGRRKSRQPNQNHMQDPLEVVTGSPPANGSRVLPNQTMEVDDTKFEIRTSGDDGNGRPQNIQADSVAPILFPAKIAPIPMVSISSTSKHHQVMYRFNSESGQFSCGICFKEFWKKIELRRHYKQNHQNVRYWCTHCSKMFKQERHYIRHNQTMHERSQFYNCQFCDQICSSKYNMTIHIQRKHPGELR